MKKTYQIGGMSCSACASAVERILKRMDGVTSAQVNLVLEEVVVEGEDLPAFADMQKAVEKGISINLLESRAGVSTGSIYKWNTVSPTVRSLSKVAKVLGCTIDELLG